MDQFNGTLVDFLTPPVNDEERYAWYSRGGIIIGGMFAGALLTPFLLPLVLGLIGFGISGVVAGSCAACCHSNIGVVQPGSCFACMQSAGAGGQRWIFFILAIIGAVIGGYIAVISTAG